MKVRVGTTGEDKNAHEVIICWGINIRLRGWVESVKLVYSRRVGENLVDEILLFGIAWRYRGFR